MDTRQIIDILKISDDELLNMRLKDLGLSIKGSWLEECIQKLYNELKSNNIHFLPECYLADEWLCPENEPVIGIAFYLANPRLKNLEYKFMNEVEGGDTESCMKLLRHEAGHAINYAYMLYRLKEWKNLFGHVSEEYPDRYKYRPYSKSFVIHLEEWYAQYHPDEDFAETFAVWLDPSSDWKNKYKGWKAIKKLEYVDSLMKTISDKPPKMRKGQKLWTVNKIKSTLKTHYKKRKEFYAEYDPSFHDSNLNMIFPKDSPGPKKKAYITIREFKKEIIRNVALWTGEKKHIIQNLLKTLIKRCRELDLEANKNDVLPIIKITSYTTSLTMNYIYTGRFKKQK